MNSTENIPVTTIVDLADRLEGYARRFHDLATDVTDNMEYQVLTARSAMLRMVVAVLQDIAENPDVPLDDLESVAG